MLVKSIAPSLTLALILALGGMQSIAQAGVTQILIQDVNVDYDAGNQNFRLSGNSSITVEYDDPTMNQTYLGGGFNLNTLNMTGTSGDPTSISYDGGPGVMNFSDVFSSALLATSLASLDLELSPIPTPPGFPPLAGSYLTGMGSFIVSGGSLVGDFGDAGALFTAAMVFDEINNTSATFGNSFDGNGTVTLVPTQSPAPIPEIASIGIWGIVILMGIGGGIWKRRRVS